MDEIATAVRNPAMAERAGDVAQDVALCANEVIAPGGADETEQETLGFEEEGGLGGEAQEGEGESDEGDHCW